MEHLEGILYRLLCAAIALALITAPVDAQEDGGETMNKGSASPRSVLDVGLGGGYEVGWAEVPGCDCAKQRTALLGGPAGHLDLVASRLFGEQLGLQGRIEWSSSWPVTGFTYDKAIGPVAIIMDDGNEGIRNAVVRFSSTFTIDALQLDLLGRLRLPQGVVVAIGPYLGRSMIYDANRTETLLEPSGGIFAETSGLYPNANRGRTRVYVRNEGLDTTWRAGALLLLSLPIELGAGFQAVPELRLRADFIKPFETDYWETFNPGAGLTVTYSLADAPPLPSPPPALALIDIYALASDGGHMEEGIIRGGMVQRVRHLKLAPAIAFDSSSTALPSRYLAHPATTPPLFRADSIARLDADVIERSTPDLLGAWLASRSGDVGLVASVADGERDEVALARAESVRRYLSAVWGIDATRISLMTEPGAARSVRMDGAIEIDAGWSERRVESAPVRVEPAIASDAGVRSWRIRLEHEGREIASRRSDEEVRGLNLEMLMSDLEHGASRSPLVAELEVEDSSGATSIARDTLRFRFEENGVSSRLTEYLLLGATASGDLVEGIAASAGGGSRVTITPLSGRATEREAASALASRLGERGIDARLASPPEDGKSVWGMKIEIDERVAGHP